MRWATWVTKPNTKKIMILLTVVIISAGLAWHFSRNNHTNSSVNTPITEQILDGSLADASQQTKQKNYSAAEQDYISAATSALSTNGPSRSIAILQQAIKDIPDKYVDWQLYDNLAATAKLAGNKTLEISSLKKALAKAQLKNSDAPNGTAESYKNLLKQLGST